VGGFYQRRLLKHLLVEGQYDPLERPVQNESQTLPVSINLALQQIIDFVSEIKMNLLLLFYIQFFIMNRMARISSLLLVVG
jgi:hypothetical protein